MTTQSVQLSTFNIVIYIYEYYLRKLLIMCMLTYLQDIDRLSVYVVCNFALSLSLFYLLLYVLLCDMLVAYGPLSLIKHQFMLINHKLQQYD